MPAKRILLVDDQREVTRLLRSALETLNRGDIIVEVPSGEEALLEIGRGGADLLVLDVRLPGISGLDVVRRLRRINSKAQVILISGVADARLEAEAQNLGVLAFLRKPLANLMDTFLKVAQRALGAPPGEAEAPAEDHEPAISERLSTLRRDLGADAVYLVDMQGRVAVRAGDITSIDLDPVMAEVVNAMSASLKISRMVGGLIPSNVHFFDGDDFDLYAANVGQYYALVIIFDGERGAGQMGPVMRYGRQCADDLLNALVTLGVGLKAETPAAFASRAAPAATKAPPATARAQPPKATPAPVPAPAPVAAPPPAPAKPEKPLTEAELKALDEALAKLKAEDASAFWDSLQEAEEGDTGAVRSDAISFEEAQKMGLIRLTKVA